jgi:hypothetical protein
MTKKLAGLLPILTLAACSHDTAAYPSLAPRAVEKLGFAEPETPAAAPLTVDPALDARIASVTARLDAVAHGFDAALAKAQAAARAAGTRTVGSDAWLDAQTALGGLDDWRAQASALAAEASDLAGARAQALAPEYPALARLQAAAETETARQDGAIGRIQGSLPAA